MSISQAIGPHLPLLRRYARALTGNQESGDRYVAASLEAILQAPDEFPRNVQPRVGLYQVFQKKVAGAKAPFEALRRVSDERQATTPRRPAEPATPRRPAVL